MKKYKNSKYRDKKFKLSRPNKQSRGRDKRESFEEPNFNIDLGLFEETDRINYVMDQGKDGKGDHFSNWDTKERNHMFEFVRGKVQEDVLSHRRKVRKKKKQDRIKTAKKRINAKSVPLQLKQINPAPKPKMDVMRDMQVLEKRFDSDFTKLKSETSYSALKLKKLNEGSNIKISSNKKPGVVEKPKVLFKTLSKNTRKQIQSTEDIKQVKKSAQIDSILSQYSQELAGHQNNVQVKQVNFNKRLSINTKQQVLKRSRVRSPVNISHVVKHNTIQHRKKMITQIMESLESLPMRHQQRSGSRMTSPSGSIRSKTADQGARNEVFSNLQKFTKVKSPKRNQTVYSAIGQPNSLLQTQRVKLVSDIGGFSEHYNQLPTQKVSPYLQLGSNPSVLHPNELNSLTQVECKVIDNFKAINTDIYSNKISNFISSVKGGGTPQHKKINFHSKRTSYSGSKKFTDHHVQKPGFDDEEVENSKKVKLGDFIIKENKYHKKYRSVSDLMTLKSQKADNPMISEMEISVKLGEDTPNTVESKFQARKVRISKLKKMSRITRASTANEVPNKHQMYRRRFDNLNIEPNALNTQLTPQQPAKSILRSPTNQSPRTLTKNVSFSSKVGKLNKPMTSNEGHRHKKSSSLINYKPRPFEKSAISNKNNLLSKIEHNHSLSTIPTLDTRNSLKLTLPASVSAQLKRNLPPPIPNPKICRKTIRASRRCLKGLKRLRQNALQ